jgi:hypothetical protein
LNTGEVVIKISKDGSKVELDGQGFQNSSCDSLIGPIIEKLGKVMKEKKKPEFFVDASSTTGIDIGGGI